MDNLPKVTVTIRFYDANEKLLKKERSSVSFWSYHTNMERDGDVYSLRTVSVDAVAGAVNLYYRRVE